jgi:hypothetical protein
MSEDYLHTYYTPYYYQTAIMRYAIIANSTFRHNNISHNGEAVRCNMNCSIISSVLKLNFGNGSLLGGRSIKILASSIAYNSFPQYLSEGATATIDCSYFTNNTPQQYSSTNSITCNQLLVPGESAVCQHENCDSEGKMIKSIQRSEFRGPLYANIVIIIFKLT